MRRAGELATLIGIHNLWFAMALERLLQHRNRMTVASKVIATVAG